MSTTSVPTNLLKPAVVFSSLTFIFALTVVAIMLGVTLSAPPRPPIIPGVPVPFDPTPVKPELRNFLMDANSDSNAAAGISAAAFTILSVITTFLTLCMVWAMHAQGSK